MIQPGDIVAALVALYRTHEVPGLFLFLLIEEAGIPLLLPGDTLIIAAGARPDRPLASSLAILAAASGAATLGSSLLYALVRRGGRSLLARYGRYLHLNEARVHLLERWFRRHGALAIVVGRLVPGLRTPTSVMAGLFDVPYRTFAPATTLAALLWAALYFFLGALLERGWHALVGRLLGHVGAVVAVAVAVAALASVVAALIWRDRRRRPPLDEPPRAGSAHGGGAEREPCNNS